MSKFIAAAIQMASTDDMEENLRQAGLLLEEAAARGAKLAALPEYLHKLAHRSKEAAEEILKEVAVILRQFAGHVLQVVIGDAETIHQISDRLDAQVTGTLNTEALLLGLAVFNLGDKNNGRVFIASAANSCG